MFLLSNFWRFNFILSSGFNDDLALFSCNGANLLTYLFDLIIKSLLLL